MPTTRHLVNRRRRLAAAPPRTTATDADAATGPPTAPTDTPRADGLRAEAARPDGTRREEPPADDPPPAPEPGPRRRPRRTRAALPVVLGVLTVLLGAFAVQAFVSAADLREEPARQNAALTDIGRTSEAKGRITEAVDAVFSYDYASPARSERAADTYLTGRAVRQHQDMLAEVREQAPRQKLVLTTTVTESGVEFLDGDRARLLVFADQRNTRTGKDEETTYAAAMFAVDAVRRGDTWLIAAIDTFTR
ncbi:hypothetical protein [Streptomyces sp. NPDC101181]|uniref:hypothetical protein n=1 Tax=Streptomyces sp. NPDC101181 TaxID=3366125 RepID=UPI00381E784A